MSDITISNQSIQSIALDAQASSFEKGAAGIAQDARALTKPELKSIEEGNADVSGQVASRTREFFGSGENVSSTSTDNDMQQAITSAHQESGIGSIADEIA